MLGLSREAIMEERCTRLLEWSSRSELKELQELVSGIPENGGVEEIVMARVLARVELRRALAEIRDCVERGARADYCVRRLLENTRVIAWLRKRWGPPEDAREAWRAEIERACGRLHARADLAVEVKRRSKAAVERQERARRAERVSEELRADLEFATPQPPLGRPVAGTGLRVLDGGAERTPRVLTGREWVSQKERQKRSLTADIIDQGF